MPDLQKILLQEEGVEVAWTGKGWKVDLKTYGWKNTMEEAEKLAKPEKDEYLPEEKHEPSGRYWMEQGEDGQKKIHFDDPDKNPKANTPEKTPQKPEPEICKGNNDKAVREIEKLKEEKKTLEQQIQKETDEEKIKKLEQKLAQVENELRQKDNNGYLRRNTVFS